MLENSIILEEIQSLLNRCHLFNCVLVSKKWYDIFIPYLWRDIDLKWNIDTESLLRNQHHVLSIASLVEFSWQPLDSIVNLSFPNLRKITKGEHFDRDSDKSLPPQLLNLLSQTTFLDTLFLFISDNNSKELTQYLPSALQRLPNLKNLDLSIFSPTTLELVQHVIYNSRHCRLFHLTVSLGNNPTTVEAEDFRASIGRLTNTKFQDLKIHILNTEVDLDIIAPLVEQSPLLELFYLHRPYTMDTLHRILCVLQDKTRRPLKFLGVEENLEEAQPEYWKSLQELFHEASGKRRNYFMVKESTPTTIHFKQSRTGPFIPNDDIQLGIDMSMLEKLPFYFSHTLTSIQLLSMHLDWFVLLMSQLPLLQSVIATVSQRTAGPLIHTFEPTETHNLFWPCSRMKKLDIFVGMGSTINAMITHLFKEIGKLHKLEELTIAASHTVITLSNLLNRWDNSQSEGYLNHFKNFKRLYKLDLRRYTYSRVSISLEEVLWIVNNMPNLRHIILFHEAISESILPRVFEITKQYGITLDLIDFYTFQINY